jgi:MarR family transcriptional regulator, organic hydroperoxide resistance regulator
MNTSCYLVKGILITRHDDDLNLELFLLINRVFHMIHRVRREELLVHNILPAQVYILRMIQSLGPNTTPTEISKYVYRVKSSVSDILTRMEKQGLITKTKESNKTKHVIIKLTKKGENTLALTEQRTRVDNILSSLSDERKQQLKSCLQTLFDNAIDELNITQGKKLSHLPK